MDTLLLPWLKTAKVGFRYLPNEGISRGQFGGRPIVASLGGDRLAASLDFTPQATSEAESARERRLLISWLARLNGRQNPSYMTNPAKRFAGSFPTTELIADNTFASGGLSNWTLGSEYSGTVHDRRARLTRNAVTASSGVIRKNTSQMSALTQYATYAFRMFVYAGRGSIASNLSLRAGSSNGGTQYGSAAYTAAGLYTLPFVALDTPISVTLNDNAASGLTAGDYIDVPWASCSRAAMLDNGPNLLLHSDDLTQAAWTNSETTETANAAVAPDGTTTMDSINENAAAATSHYMQQNVTVSSSAEGYCFAVALKAASRTWARLTIFESTSSHAASAYFNLSTGAVGTVGATGANWENVRAYIVPRGNGIYYCVVLGQKVSAGTTLSCRIYSAEADNDVTMNGNSSAAIYAWRATLSISKAPTRLVQTTTAATTGTTQTGSGLHLKGVALTATDGLAVENDELEVITSFGSELKITTAALNCDAAGLAYWQFSPAIRGIGADGAAVIFSDPMAYMMFAGGAVGWDHEPGILTTASAEFEEAS